MIILNIYIYIWNKYKENCIFQLTVRIMRDSGWEGSPQSIWIIKEE